MHQETLAVNFKDRQSTYLNGTLLPQVYLDIIIRDMEFQKMHTWQLTPSQARKLQIQLANLISHDNEVSKPNFIAGAVGR